MNAIETLISVLCGPEGKCCISGSGDDRRLIDAALVYLAQAAQPAPATQQGAAYAEVPEKYYLAGGEVPTWDAKQMHAFADATHALRTEQPAAQQPHRSGCTAGTDEECVQRGCGTNCPVGSPRQVVAYAALPDERAAFEAQFPVPGGVHWDGTEYVVKDSHVSSYRCNRFEGQWEAWKARASHGQAPASVLHLVHSAFAEIAMAFPKAFALHKVGIADTAVRKALAAPATARADSVQEDAARYRWLREGNDAKHGAAWHVAVNLYGCEWDAAIDAAMDKGGA